MQEQRAGADAALATYEKSVLVALQEVEDALVAYHTEGDRRGALQRAVAASVRALGLAKKLYTEGTNEFLDVINAQRTLFVAQDLLVQSDQNAALSAVALYKALGGGWE
jgi:multidrug efflux system outer membrane protein